MTQEEIDGLIQKFMQWALNWEKKRDKCEFESPQYWAYHDRALRWHYQAEQLMPRSARSIRLEDLK